MSAQENQVALPLRNHTILGVCEGIGEDFGFNPVWLRIPLAASVIWNPMVAFGVYFGLGAIVLVSRLLFPKPKAAASVVVEAKPAAVSYAKPQRELEQELAEAA